MKIRLAKKIMKANLEVYPFLLAQKMDSLPFICMYSK